MTDNDTSLKLEQNQAQSLMSFMLLNEKKLKNMQSSQTTCPFFTI